MTLQLIHSPGLLPVIFTCPHSLETPDVSHVIFGSCYRPRHPSCLLIIKSRMLQICELNSQYLFDFVAQIICRRCLLEPMPSKNLGPQSFEFPSFGTNELIMSPLKIHFGDCYLQLLFKRVASNMVGSNHVNFKQFLQKTWPNKTQHSPQNRA